MTILTPERQHTLFQLIKFCLVGGSGMVIDMGVTAISTELLSLDPRIGAVLGFLFAVINNYLLNRIWTFKASKSTEKASGFLKFFTICLIGMGISVGVMHLCIAYLGWGISSPEELAAATGIYAYWLHFRYLAARFCGIVVATIWNFVGSKKLVFKS